MGDTVVLGVFLLVLVPVILSCGLIFVFMLIAHYDHDIVQLLNYQEQVIIIICDCCYIFNTICIIPVLFVKFICQLCNPILRLVFVSERYGEKLYTHLEIW